MILRRVIHHFRRQEWTAIFLDFVIVVVGVFVGLQVNNWNAARADQSRAQKYLERIIADLDADLSGYKDRIKFWTAVSEYGKAAVAYADTGDAGGRSDWDLLLAFFQASQTGEFYTTDATYVELKSAGELGLVGDIALRDELARYYTNAGNPALSERPRYREHIRGVVPLEIQSYIWAQCYRSEPDLGQFLLACDSPVSEIRAREIVAKIAGDAQLMEELRYWMSTMIIAQMIGDDRITFANEVRSLAVNSLQNAYSAGDNRKAIEQ